MQLIRSHPLEGNKNISTKLALKGRKISWRLVSFRDGCVGKVLWGNKEKKIKEKKQSTPKTSKRENLTTDKAYRKTKIISDNK